MSISAIDRIAPASIDAVRDPYRAERVRAEMRASTQAARAESARFERVQAARAEAARADAVRARAATAAPAGKPLAIVAGDPANGVDRLREQFSSDRLRSAVQAFHDEQAELQARATAANDLGTIEGLLPLQPYRVAMGNPPVQPQQLAAAAGLAPAMVSPVANVAALRNTTDDALSTDPDTRARAHRIDKTDA